MNLYVVSQSTDPFFRYYLIQLLCFHLLACSHLSLQNYLAKKLYKTFSPGQNINWEDYSYLGERTVRPLWFSNCRRPFFDYTHFLYYIFPNNFCLLLFIHFVFHCCKLQGLRLSTLLCASPESTGQFITFFFISL